MADREEVGDSGSGGGGGSGGGDPSRPSATPLSLPPVNKTTNDDDGGNGTRIQGKHTAQVAYGATPVSTRGAL